MSRNRRRDLNPWESRTTISTGFAFWADRPKGPVRSGTTNGVVQSAMCKTETVITEDLSGRHAGPRSDDHSFARQTVWIMR